MNQVSVAMQRIVQENTSDFLVNAGTILSYEAGKSALNPSTYRVRASEYLNGNSVIANSEIYLPHQVSTELPAVSQVESPSVFRSGSSALVATGVNKLFPPEVAASFVLNSFASTAIYDVIETGFKYVVGVPVIERSPKQNISLLLRALGLGITAAELATMCPVASITNILYSIVGSSVYDAAKAIMGLLKPRSNRKMPPDQIQLALKYSQLALDDSRDKGDRRGESASLVHL